MSHKDVEQIISRAVVDEQFRELLFTSPERGPGGSRSDRRTSAQALQGLSREKFDNALGDLELRFVTGGASTGAPVHHSNRVEILLEPHRLRPEQHELTS